MIKCKICGFESNASTLRNHLRQKHNLSEQEYLDLYPGSQIININLELEECPICHKKFKYVNLHMVQAHNYKYPEIDKSDDNEYVTCAICGERFKFLNQHLSSIHSITADEYKKIYNSPTCSESFRKSMSTMSDKKMKVIVARNKSDKQRNIISERNKELEFRQKCKEGIKNSETWHDVHSRATTKRNLRMWKDPEYAQYILNSVSNNRYGRKQEYTSNIFNKHFKLKSNSELQFVLLCERLCNKYNITDIVYESLVLNYKDLNEISHSYYPDFSVYINGNLKYVVEVKYDDGMEIEVNRLKSQSAIKYCQDNDLIYCWFKARYNTNIEDLNKISLMPKQDKLGKLLETP